ncbi:MAG: hypothetical protein Q4G59_08770 [Planctomycetia bacterium]|nr:hypothetical protein [Planctomycetia bacterium]
MVIHYQIGVMPPEVKNFPVPIKFRDGITSGLTCKVDVPIDIKK